MQWPFKFIGAAVGRYAGITGCEFAPDAIYTTFPKMQEAWLTTVYDSAEGDQITALSDFSTRLAEATSSLLAVDEHFISFGGDHSCAIGTWSGVAQHYDDFGLIWIDAHMDAHTPETSPSGNLHGMPVAALLGYGEERLTFILSKQPKLKPENIVLFGIRSYEPEEKHLLDKLGVKIYYAEDLQKIDFLSAINKTIADFKQRQLKFGISIDLDGLDPQDISSLGTPVDNGIRLAEFLTVVEQLNYDDFIGLEITEYNPSLDASKQDIKVIEKIVAPFFHH